MSSRVTRPRPALTIVFLLVAVCVIAAHASPVTAGEAVFTQWLSSAPTSLDPAKSNHPRDDQAMWLMYDALTQLSADGTRMLPALAERWEKSADNLTYTFTLRKNVRFHDGSMLDAEAVKASYERQYLKTSAFYTADPPNAYENVLSGLIKEIRTIDPHTVIITTKYERPTEFAIVKLVSPQALKKFSGDLSKTPVGTGPFRLDRWKDDGVLLAPFDDSWHGRAKVAGVLLRAVTAEKEAMGELDKGQFDLLFPVSPDFFEQLRANPQITLVNFGGLNTMFIGIVLTQPTVKDRRVREALVRGVDRERLAALLGRGAMIAAKSILPPNCRGFDPNTSQPAYNPERARALLNEAGFESGPRLRLLYVAPSELWSEVVRAVKADLEKVGFAIELLEAHNWNEYHDIRKKGTHDLYLYSWSVSTPDPERFLYGMFYSESKSNFSHLASPKIDKLLTEARQPMDEARRLQIHAEVNRLVTEETPALFLAHRVWVAGVSSRVKGLTLNLYGLPQDKLSKVELR